MTDNSQFWWNWAVQLATAIATFLAVIVALFLDWFRARFFPPELELRLVDRHGAPPVHTTVPMAAGQSFATMSRWYHVEVRNNRRMSGATDTRVCLVAVEEQDAAGHFVGRSTGNIPLTARHEAILRPGRIVGSPVEYNLCSVLRDSAPGGGGQLFSLHPVVTPTDITVQTRQPFRTAYILEAQSVERDSPRLRVEVAWNGQWSDDTAVMANNLVINARVLP